MNFILVWVLVSSGGQWSNEIVYSPPMQTQNECLKLKSNVEQIQPTYKAKFKCVQITMGVAK